MTEVKDLDLSKLEELTIDQFAPAVGETVSVSSPDGLFTAEMTLSNAEEQPTNELSPRRAPPFVLTFHAPIECNLRDWTYNVKNDKIGEHAIFITASGHNDLYKTYEANFC